MSGFLVVGCFRLIQTISVFVNVNVIFKLFVYGQDFKGRYFYGNCRWSILLYIYVINMWLNLHSGLLGLFVLLSCTVAPAFPVLAVQELIQGRRCRTLDLREHRTDVSVILISLGISRNTPKALDDKSSLWGPGLRCSPHAKSKGSVTALGWRGILIICPQHKGLATVAVCNWHCQRASSLCGCHFLCWLI